MSNTRNKRSLFNIVFGNKKDTTIREKATQLQVLNNVQATFTTFNGKLYDTTQVRTCIDAIARNGAKLNPKHIRNTDKVYQDKQDNLLRLLSEQPNKLMNAYDFYYKIISQLYLNNNAFVYIEKDKDGKVISLIPINYQKYTLYEYNEDIFIKFDFLNGKNKFLSLQDEVIHLKRFYCENDITGGNSQPITKTMSVKHIVDEGIINAIKTTQGIKGVIKSTKSMLKPEDVKKMRDQFVDDLFDNADGNGIGGLDATSDFTPVKIDPQTATDGQLSTISKEIKDYFGISDEIIQSKYTEDQWNAFYESVIEPIGIMLSLEFTNKLFSYGEKIHGNKIIFEANRLQYASNNTKIAIAEKMNNYMTINEIREIFNLPPVEDGDKIMQDLNHIDNNIANQYQVGETKTEEDIVVTDDKKEVSENEE